MITRGRIITVLVAVAGMALLASTASAAPTSFFKFKASLAPTQGFVEPYDVAVNQATGDVYVANRGGEAVDVFNSSNVFEPGLPTFSCAGHCSGAWEYNVTRDEARGETIIGDDESATVFVYGSAGDYLATIEGTPSGRFTPCCYVWAAVDNSTSVSDPSAGDLYIASNAGLNGGPNGIVAKYKYEAGSWTFVSSFGGEETAAKSFPREAIWGTAVDPLNGDVFVAERGLDVVAVYGPEGVLKNELTGTPGGHFGTLTGVAVDGATGAVFVSDEGSHAVDIFNGNGEYQYQLLGTTPTTLFTSLRGLAVNEASEVLYVSDAGPKLVQAYEPEAGTPPQPKTDAPAAVTSHSAELKGDFNPKGAATDYFFAYNTGEGCEGGHATPVQTSEAAADTEVHATIEPLEPNTEYAYCLEQAPAEIPGAATFKTAAVPPVIGLGSPSDLLSDHVVLHGTVDPNNDDTTFYFKYGLTTAYGSTSSPPPGISIGQGNTSQEVEATLDGLTGNTTYHYQLIAINSAGEEETSDGSFTTLPNPPQVALGEVTEATPFSVKLQGSVNPENAIATPAAETVYCFEYGTDQTYNLGYLPLSGPVDVGAGTSDIPASAVLSGLSPNTTYHYRLVAINTRESLELAASGCHISKGQQAASADSIFTTPAASTPPLVETNKTANVTQNTATLSGTVDPRGFQTAYQFQVGVDTSYGADIYGSVGAGNEPVDVRLDLVGLAPGTTYHYRLVGVSDAGTTYGPDQSFTTTIYPSSFIRVPSSLPLIATPPYDPLSTAGAITPTEQRVVKHSKKKHSAKRRKGKAGKRGRKSSKSRRSSRYGRSK